MRADAVVIGAGFYGCSIALHLQTLGIGRIVLADTAPAIMTRASFANQARVHGGYHYPRSLVTGHASRESYGRFAEDFAYAIATSSRSIYAIARSSRVTPSQFERFCLEIGAPLHIATGELAGLFDQSLIEAVYQVQEATFDATVIANELTRRLGNSPEIHVALSSQSRLERLSSSVASVRVGDTVVETPIVINCTYANLDGVGIPLSRGLRREMAEMAMIEMPGVLATLGVTVMDGPFFSTLPFPSQGCHSLSHVRYTPMASSNTRPPSDWINAGFGAPINARAMLRDASRYLPLLKGARLRGSIFEIKTVLQETEGSDARPILAETLMDQPFVISVLGGKLDNIYDCTTYLTHALR